MSVVDNITFCIAAIRNILLHGAMRAKIGDFGFAMQLQEETDGKSLIRTSTLCGTPGYVAPEFLSVDQV